MANTKKKVDAVSGADKYSAKSAHKAAMERYDKAMQGKSMANIVADELRKKGIDTTKSKDGKVYTVQPPKKMKCGGKVHKMKSGGKVRGCGKAKSGARKAKMY